ncbi:MAG: quinate 5-dehydrogenase [Candidatus Heimdallarchaeota archaeon]|nr:quinate 5-dehydrogenase [Candidatus Heimdallarchaeota archaeon]
MKSAVSISLGSAIRDHQGIINLGGTEVSVQRIGVDGDSKLMNQRYKELDGKVDAFGAGGFIFGFKMDDRYYTLRSVKKLTKGVILTPVVDGSGVKTTVERTALQSIWSEIEHLFDNKPKTALVTSAIDRWGMTKSITDAGFETVFGDLYFALGIRKEIKTQKGAKRLARLMMPIVKFMPISMLYPVGDTQKERKPKYTHLFENATVIGGDFIYTKKYSPDDMKEKIILTNTTTKDDRDDLFSRGVEAIITTTPEIGGRSFGTNVLEAAIVAEAGLNRGLTEEEMLQKVDQFNLKPTLHLP